MHRIRNVLLAAGLSVTVASCADAQRTVSPPTVSDSAGIRIVVNAWPTNVAATVGARPGVEIGGGADATGDLAGVVAAARLSDGRIAIAEQSTRSIKLFDARGRFVRSMGRQGSGPGEFAAITRLALSRGDTLVAYDGLRGVLSIFDTGGRLVRMSRLMTGTGGLQLQGMLGDGTMVLSRGYNPVFSRTSRLERDSISYLTAKPGTADMDTIATVPGSDVYLFAGPDFSSRNPVPFGRVSLIGVQDDRIALATGDRWEIELRSPSGQLRELHRVRGQPVEVTRRDIARYRSDYLDRLRGNRPQPTGGGGAPPDIQARMIAQREKMLDAVPYPRTHAPYDSLVVGHDGDVWLRVAGPPTAEPRTWLVLTRSGAAAGIVAIPGGLRLLQVGRDFIVAVRRDEDDVEHVGVYPLRRQATGG